MTISTFIYNEKKAPKFTKKILKLGTKYKQQIKKTTFFKLILNSVSPESEGNPYDFRLVITASR